MMAGVEIWAKERIGTAIHEASHAVVARHFGCYLANPRIWPNASDDPYESSWLGHCRFISKPDGELSQHERTLIGLAGVVGEYIHDGETEPWEIAEYLCYVDEISETDMEAIGGREYLETDISDDLTKVIELLNLYWDEVVRMAGECIDFWREDNAQEG